VREIQTSDRSDIEMSVSEPSSTKNALTATFASPFKETRHIADRQPTTTSGRRQLLPGLLDLDVAIKP
jgi:hypothetical protein